jgi:hypothetical protein
VKAICADWHKNEEKKMSKESNNEMPQVSDLGKGALERFNEVFVGLATATDSGDGTFIVTIGEKSVTFGFRILVEIVPLS